MVISMNVLSMLAPIAPELRLFFKMAKQYAHAHPIGEYAVLYSTAYSTREQAVFTLSFLRPFTMKT